MVFSAFCISSSCPRSHRHRGWSCNSVAGYLPPSTGKSLNSIPSPTVQNCLDILLEQRGEAYVFLGGICQIQFVKRERFRGSWITYKLHLRTFGGIGRCWGKIHLRMRTKLDAPGCGSSISLSPVWVQHHHGQLKEYQTAWQICS